MKETETMSDIEVEADVAAVEAPQEERAVADVLDSKREEFSISSTVEVRKRDGKEIIVGHIPYDTVSHPLGERGEFREVLKPGVFAKHLATHPDVIAKWDHGHRGMGLPLGRTKSGTLRVEERTDGLHYEVEAPDTQEGRDVVTSIKRGDVTGTSFGFRAKRERWANNPAVGGHLRELHEAELTDVSPTPDPAYPHTNLRVALRGLQLVEPDEYRRLIEVQEDRSIRPGNFVKWMHEDGDRTAHAKIGKVIESRSEGKLRIHGTDIEAEGHRANPVHMVCEYRDLDNDGVHEPSGHVHLVRDRSLERLDDRDAPTDDEMLKLFDLAKQHEQQEIQDKDDRLRLLEHSGPMVGVGANLDGEPSYE